MKKLLFIALGLLCLIPMLQAAPYVSIAKKVEGKVSYAAPGSNKFQPLKAGTALPHGSQVKTEKGARAVVLLMPGAAANVAENTSLTLRDCVFAAEGKEVKERAGRVHLTTGTVTLLVDASTTHINDVRVITPQGEAACRGTFFVVTVEDDNTFVKVDEGKVALLSNKDKKNSQSGKKPETKVSSL